MDHRALALVIGAGWGVRTFLQTEVLDRLRDAADVVVLAHPDLTPVLRERYGHRLTAIEPLAENDPSAGERGRILRQRARSFMHGAANETRRAKLRRTRPSGWRDRLLASRVGLAARRATPARLAALARAEETAWRAEAPAADQRYEAFFRDHHVGLAVATTAYLAIEAPPVWAARRLGVDTVCWVNSWDNLTSKGPMPVPFDAYFVWSERMAEELDRYYPESRGAPVTATGVPHFDGYAHPASLGSRETFCAEAGLDPARPIVLYAACTPFLAPNEHLVVDRLAANLACLEGRPQLFVRLHPADPGTRFRDLAHRRDVAIEMPGAARDGRPAGIHAFCPDRTESRRALATVVHADVVVNIASTISLEAALVDRPTVNVAYDLAPGAPDADRIAGYYRYDHYRTVVEAGAVRVARSPTELTDAIRAYLDDPTRDREGRERLARLWCATPGGEPTDGGAGRRLGEALAARLPPIETQPDAAR